MNPEQIEQLLTAYALGDLDADTARIVEAHLEHSEPCRRELAEIRETIGVLQKALLQPLPAGLESLEPARRAAVLAPPPAEAAAAASALPPAGMGLWFSGWLRMAATLAIAGGAMWVGVRQYLGDSGRALKSEVDSGPASTPMDIAVVSESDLRGEFSRIEEKKSEERDRQVEPEPAKPAPVVSRRQEALTSATGDRETPSADQRIQVAGETSEASKNLAAPGVVKLKENEKKQELEVAVTPPASQVVFPAGTSANNGSLSLSKAVPAAPASPAPSEPRLAGGDLKTGPHSETAGKKDVGLGWTLDADEAVADVGADGVTQDKDAVQALGNSFAAAKETAPAKVGEDTARKDMNIPAAARGGGFESKAGNTYAGSAAPGQVSAVASQPVPTKAAAPKPAAAKPAAPESGPDRTNRESQFADDSLRQAEITGFSQSTTRVGAVFAAEEQGLTMMNSVGGRVQIDQSLYPGVRVRPGAVEERKLRSMAKGKLAYASDEVVGQVFQFGFVRPFNLAAMLEEAVAAGKIDLPALGAQPERWTSSFTYAVGGRPMGGMRAGIRRVATPVDATDALVVLIDSGSEPVSGSMRVVLRPDAASSARLVGYASNSATLIPGDTAEPGSLAVAVIELKSPREGDAPLGRLEVEWTTAAGESGRETLPLQESGLSEADAVWAAAMALTADAMQRGDPASLEAWGRTLAAHPRNRPGTLEARVIEALRKVVPTAVPYPVFRKT